MFKGSLISLAFLTSTACAFSSIAASPAMAQVGTTEQSRPLTILKQKDFSTTVDAIQALTHRTIPLEDIKTEELGVKTDTSEKVENKTDETAQKNETALKEEDTKDNKTPEQDAVHDKNTKNEDNKKADDLNKDEKSENTAEEKQETKKENDVKIDPANADTENSEEANKAKTEETTKPQRTVLPRQNIDLHFANYQDTRLFLKDLAKKFGEPVKACSRSSINLYRLPNDFTLRVYMTNLDPNEVSQGSSVDGINGVRMILIDGKLSDDCDIDTLKPEERISFSALKQLSKDILDAGDTLDEKKAETLISTFGTPERKENDCFVTFSLKPEKELPNLDVSISALKPDCKPKSGYAGLLISYEPQENNGVVLATDPAMSIKMARALEETFNMEALHNIAYLWKNGDIFGVIRTSASPLLPMTFQIEDVKGKLSMEVGHWFGSDAAHYQTLWNAGEQPYGGLTTSEEFIP